MQTSDFDYFLPPECIAQRAAEPRDSARLMILDRSKEGLEHRRFYELGDYLRANDLLVVNRTRVIPARFFARKLPSGGKAELLLLNKEADGSWQALVGGKNIIAGTRLQVQDGPGVEVLADLGGGRRRLRFEEEIEAFYSQAGHIPLPPYIRAYTGDMERYQTVYSREPGSAAAPTAGLHFTEQLLTSLQERGVNLAELILHVGLDTFAPVTENDPEEHKIHSEWCCLDAETAQMINAARAAGGRVIAVGTTSVRTLETAASHSQDDLIHAWEGNTRLFILPGYQFQVVDAMVTNFHLPKSSLLMLVSAFAGRERILGAYRQAVELGYRFFSFGDAMLLL
jgi:S-adenosylmethionine:tRNA ribosyltransferase-isomerase